MTKNVIIKNVLFLCFFIFNREILAQDFCKTPHNNLNLLENTSVLIPNYKPMLNQTTWFSAATELEGDMLNYYKTIGDTMITGLKYAIIENQFISNQIGGSNRIAKTYFMLREDTVSQKVYYRNAFEERILYDFSIQIGQSMTGYIWNFLRKIDTVETGIGKRRRLIFSNTAQDTSI